MSETLSPAASHLRALISCRSVTPAEGGAQAYIADQLGALGFTVERMNFSEEGYADVPNLFARIGHGAPHLVFVGHTDVVPPGDSAMWTHDPFGAVVSEGRMFGRGAQDMKGGIAAFLAAAQEYGKPGTGTLSLAITGDEEGPSVNGMTKLLGWAMQQGHRFDAALVGEPTSRERLGDTIKIGRRGSLSGTIIVTGEQGHVAYPHLAHNPIPLMVRILSRLTQLKLDEGSFEFEPSNLEVTSVETGNATYNVIPAEIQARFNVRFNDYWSMSGLKALIKREIAEAGDCELIFEAGSSDWFLTQSDSLIEPMAASIKAVTGLVPARSTAGGTSDARFFKDICPVIEVGLVGDTMHQVDERVPLADLDQLSAVYRKFLDRFFLAFR